MASQEDCFFFFNSTCTKGDDCAFRHERGALGSSVVCQDWRNGTCNRNPCYFRHGMPEATRMAVPCFYENTPMGCLNSSCQYLHHKPRPFLNETQFPMATQRLQNPRPGAVPARFNPPFPQRFMPPQNQQYRAPSNFLDFSGAKMLGDQQRHFRHPLPERLPVPLNHPQRPVLLPNTATIRPNRFPQTGHNVRNAGAMVRPPRGSIRTPFMPRDGREKGMVPSISNVPSQLMGGNGPLGNVPVSHGGMIPYNIFPGQAPHASKPTKSGQTSRDSRIKRSSSKRTVKKLDSKRSRKPEKSLKRRDGRRFTEDAIVERKRRREKEFSSTKILKDSTKRRKREKDVTSDKIKVSLASKEVRSDDKDATREDAEDMKEEAGFSFKVKTLEEILRDKALKKLRERQGAKETDENPADTIDEDDPSFISIIGGPEEDKLTNSSNIDAPGAQKENTPTTSTPDDGKNQQNTLPENDLDKVKVKSLAEIRDAKLKAAENAEDTKTHEPRTLKPLKPLTKKGRGRKVVVVVQSGGGMKADGNSGDGDFSKADGGTNVNIAGASGVKVDGKDTTGEGGGTNAALGNRHTKRTLPPLRKLTKSPKTHSKNTSPTEISVPVGQESIKRITEKNLKRKREQQTYRRLVKTSRSRLSSGNASVSPTQGSPPVPANPKQEARVFPVLAVVDWRNSDDTNGSARVPTTSRINKVKPLIPASADQVNNMKPKALGVEEKNISQEGGESQIFDLRIDNSKQTIEKQSNELTERPVKKIKLKRRGLENGNGSQEGGARKPLTLGRKLKISRKEPTVNNTQVETEEVTGTPRVLVSGEETGSSLQTTEDTKGHNLQNVITNIFKTHIPNKISVGNLSRTTKTVDTFVNTSTRPCSINSANITPSTFLSPESLPIEETSLKIFDSSCDASFNEKEGSKCFVLKERKQDLFKSAVNKPVSETKSEAAKASDEPSRTGVQLTKGPKLEKVHKLQSAELLPRKSYLDQIVKEVTDDLVDDDGDLLDEDLERAIAELSPAVTDDEDDVSNADDLLLEIEEMINS